MSYPPCFDGQKEYDEWVQACINVRRNGRGRGEIPNYCVDCTPMYSKQMKAQGRCTNTNVRFYKSGTVYVGLIVKVEAANLEKMEGKWELVDEHVTDAEKPKINAGTWIPLLHN